jgi:hypothetical protein
VDLALTEVPAPPVFHVLLSYLRPHRVAIGVGAVLSLVTGGAVADRMVVTDCGRVRAAGTHAELVAGDELHVELAATQFLATAPPRWHHPPGPVKSRRPSMVD